MGIPPWLKNPQCETFHVAAATRWYMELTHEVALADCGRSTAVRKCTHVYCWLVFAIWLHKLMFGTFRIVYSLFFLDMLMGFDVCNLYNWYGPIVAATRHGASNRSFRRMVRYRTTVGRKMEVNVRRAECSLWGLLGLSISYNFIYNEAMWGNLRADFHVC